MAIGGGDGGSRRPVGVVKKGAEHRGRPAWGGGDRGLDVCSAGAGIAGHGAL